MKNSPPPPKLVHRFFRWFCNPALLDRIESDLLELYHYRLIKQGRRKADLLFMIDVILLLRPAIVRKVKISHLFNQQSMFKTYLKTAFRNLIRHKAFSFVNIFGLTVGISCCMLIAVYIFHEISYDKYHNNINNLYQLGTTFVKEGKDERTTSTPAPMAAAIEKEFPEILETARLLALFTEDKTLLQYNSGGRDIKSFYETKGFMADASLFRLFTYDFTEGVAATALEEPNTIVLSEEIAKKMFGNEQALNKVIHVNSNTNGESDLRVTGVFRPFDKPSQINARFFISMRGGDIEQFMRQQTDMISNNMFSTFLLMKPGTVAGRVEAKFPAFIDKYMGAGLKAAGFYKKQFLLPVKDIHLYAGVANDISPVGSVTYLYILGSVALFTLVIACINFMNLSTARSFKRCVEVGIRKVLGGQRTGLVWQFLCESLLISGLAFFLALAITKFSLPAFSRLSGKNLSLHFRDDIFIIGGFFLMAVITGLVAGSYPALYLSSFRPVKVLKGKLSNNLSVIFLRKGLVVFQFTISIMLIIASVIIMKQMNEMRSAELGFAKDQQIVIPLRSSTAKNIYRSLKNEIINNSKVSEVGASLYYPGIVNPSDVVLYKEGKTINDAKTVNTNWIDDSFLQTLGIKVIAGRLFSKEFPADSAGRIILNETAIRKIGFDSAKEAIGATVKFDWRGKTDTWTIIGVVKDFHFQDLHVAIEPYGFFLNNMPEHNYLIVHAGTPDIASVLTEVKETWQKLNPAEPFEYSFLDEDFQKNYESEERLSSIVNYFTAIAIIISCLGLFGLSIFSVEQRIKEIGIRKVLGANSLTIVRLLSKDFLRLVCIAIIIASPVSWWIMNQWLQGFAYRTNIGWKVFFITSTVSLMIAVITISFQSVKAALANPVKSLRTE